MVHPFSCEFDQLRKLGFAEALPLHQDGAAGTVARFECGRIGVAIEFFAPNANRAYSLVALDGRVVRVPSVVSDRWDDIVSSVRRHTPPSDDD